MPISAAIFGATGLTGKHLVSIAAGLDHFTSLYTVSRREPYTSPESTPKLTAIIEKDTDKWCDALRAIDPVPDVVMSALGTNRAQAGGIKEQWKIDHDLNISLARTAHSLGIKLFLFVSSAGTRGALSLSSLIPYSRMKIGVEDALQSLDFPLGSIILRPCAILGERDSPHPGGPLLNSAVNSLAYISPALRDAMGQDVDVIAKAGLAAVMMTLSSARDGEGGGGKKEKSGKYWVLERGEILKLGRDEWKEGGGASK